MTLSPPRTEDPPDTKFTDPHTDFMRMLLLRGLKSYRSVRAEDIPAPSDLARPELAVQRFSAVGAGGVELPRADEDTPVRAPWTRFLVDGANRFAPWDDRPDGWVSEIDCARGQEARFAGVLPRPHVNWGDPTGTEALALFVRQGIGCHRVEATEQGFVLSFEALEELPVRPGFAPYGGRVELDAAGRFASLRYRGRRVEPGDPDFDHAAFVFRSSALITVTVMDHLGLTHYGVSNTLLLAVRRALRFDHPLRRFLKPFLYRTGTINQGAMQSLLPQGALVHRASALQWESLERVYRGMLGGARFEPMPESLRSRGMHPEQLGARLSAFPWSEDGVLWWAGLEDFVAQAFASSPALGGCLEGSYGQGSRRFWEHLRAGVPGLPALDSEALQAALVWLIHVVTAVHAHVGHVAPYVRDPTFAAARVWPGSVQADRQNTAQMSTVAALTGLDVPRVGGDWSHLMPDEPAREAARRFRAWLAVHQEGIDRRNEQRPIPFVGFSPRCIPCSVSR